MERACSVFPPSSYAVDPLYSHGFEDRVAVLRILFLTGFLLVGHIGVSSGLIRNQPTAVLRRNLSELSAGTIHGPAGVI
jgi:hypothetical protein